MVAPEGDHFDASQGAKNLETRQVIDQPLQWWLLSRGQQVSLVVLEGCCESCFAVGERIANFGRWSAPCRTLETSILVRVSFLRHPHRKIMIEHEEVIKHKAEKNKTMGRW